MQFKKRDFVVVVDLLCAHGHWVTILRGAQGQEVFQCLAIHVDVLLVPAGLIV
jgi:hypothetical protein